MSKLSLKAEGDKVVVVTRHFEAPPEEVYRAHTETGILQQWLLGPEGWTMPVCVSEPVPNGKMRFEWSDGQGNGFHLTGEYQEIEPGKRIVHVERMHLPDPTPDNNVETTFEADAKGTLLTLRMTLPTSEVREMMLSTGMEHGMEHSYRRLDSLLEKTIPAQKR